MAGKYYAVRKGTVTGIFRTWEECKKNVHGYSGAEYKSFKTLEEAEAYMKGGAVAEEVTDTVPIYVDGSYNKVTKEFSYGMVVLLKEGEQIFCESYRDEELATMHNVAGEIKGAEAAMRYAMEPGSLLAPAAEGKGGENEFLNDDPAAHRRTGLCHPHGAGGSRAGAHCLGPGGLLGKQLALHQ